MCFKFLMYQSPLKILLNIKPESQIYNLFTSTEKGSNIWQSKLEVNDPLIKNVYISRKKKGFGILKWIQQHQQFHMQSETHS